MPVPRVAAACALTAAVAVVACGGSSGHATSARSSTRASATTSEQAPVVRGSANAPSWATYGGSNSRSGIVPGAPSKPKLKRRFERSVDGEVYAQPLISGGRIYVATENNTVYAF